MRQFSSCMFAFVFVVLFGSALFAQKLTDNEVSDAVASAAIAFAQLVPKVYTDIREKERPTAIIKDHLIDPDDTISLCIFAIIRK